MIASEVQLALFAIEAGVRMGRSIHTVLINESIEGPLLLPIGNLGGEPSQSEVQRYFDDNPELANKDGQPFCQLPIEDRFKAYVTIKRIELQVEDPALSKEIVASLHKLERVKAEYRASSSMAGTIVDSAIRLAIDYAAYDPSFLGLKQQSPAYQVAFAFLSSLEKTDFAQVQASGAEGVVRQVLWSAFQSVEENAGLISDNERLQVLMRGMCTALVDDLNGAQGDVGETSRREQLLQRVASSVVRGGFQAFNEHGDLFLGNLDQSQRVHSAIIQLVEGVRENGLEFAPQSLEPLAHSVLIAVGENPDLFADRQTIKALMNRTAAVLRETQGDQLFEGILPILMQESVELLREHSATLIDPNDPNKQRLAEAMGVLSLSLQNGAVKLLSKQQLSELSQIVLTHVAENPEALLSRVENDTRKTALAQIIASVAFSVGENPGRFVRGGSFVELVDIAIEKSLENWDKLLDLNAGTVDTNRLYQVMSGVMMAIQADGDPRNLITPKVFNALMLEAITVCSTKVDQIQAEKVRATLARVLELARTEMENGINGANLPQIFRAALYEVLGNQVQPGQGRLAKVLRNVLNSEFQVS